MQPSIDKKWFVFLGDRNEGPFSLAELEIKRDQGVVTRDSYVWTEGMVDWGQVRSIEDLQESFPENTSAPAVPVINPSNSAEKTVILSAPIKSSGSTRRVVINLLLVLIFLSLGWGGWQVYRITRLEGVQYWAFQAVDRFPDLGKWISPLPALPDVSPEDYADLKSAVLGQVVQVGPKVTFALSRADLLNPKFYLASNLPDGARFDIYVEGISDTLLNTLHFNAKLEGILQKRLSLSPVLRYSDGRLVPRGQYIVTVVEGEQQPPAVQTVLADLQSAVFSGPDSVPRGRKLLARKTIFLGGLQDQVYQERLKEYHDKVRAKAAQELGEAKQFLATLESQVTMSNTTFARVRRTRGAAARSAWRQFHERWIQLDQQIKESFSHWTPDVLQNDFFYGPLFLNLQKLGEATFRLHETQDAHFSDPSTVDAATLSIRLGEADSQVQVSLAELKMKIEGIEKREPSANGLPTREGL